MATASFPKYYRPPSWNAPETRLRSASRRPRRRVGTAHDARLDPNAANQRVYNLPALDPVFIDLLCREDALDAARAACGRPPADLELHR
jgi:hypothetical protein